MVLIVPIPLSNLRSAKATDVYVAKGGGGESYQVVAVYSSSHIACSNSTGVGKCK